MVCVERGVRCGVQVIVKDGPLKTACFDWTHHN